MPDLFVSLTPYNRASVRIEVNYITNPPTPFAPNKVMKESALVWDIMDKADLTVDALSHISGLPALAIVPYPTVSLKEPGRRKMLDSLLLS